MEGVIETDAVPIALECIDPIDGTTSLARITNGKLDKFFRDENTEELKGMTPEKYIKEYKNYLKRIKK